jgi:hypothetical protein
MYYTVQHFSYQNESNFDMKISRAVIFCMKHTTKKN